MSNVVSFADALQRRKDAERLANLTDAGLDQTGLTIATLAANCAFSSTDPLYVPSLDEASNMGVGALRYLGVTTHESEDETWVITFLSDQLPVIHYLLTDGNYTHDWHEVDAVSVPLDTDEYAPRTVSEKLVGWLRDLNRGETLSNYGFFAMQFMHIAAASKLSPLNLQYFPETGMVGLILYDNLRDADVAVIANLNNWWPVVKDSEQTDLKTIPST